MVHQAAILGHRVGKRDAMFKMRQLVILDTVTGGDMDKAGSLFRGDIVGKQHRHIMIIAVIMHGMSRDRPFDVGSLQRRQGFGTGDADGRRHLGDKVGRKTDHIPVRRQRAILQRRDAQHRIVDIRSTGHRPVAWHGPWCRRPDDDVRPLERRMAWRRHRKAGIDGHRGVILIFDLGLGEGGLLDRRPHHRFGAAIQTAIHQQPPQLGGNGRLGVIGHGGVGVLPVTKNTQTLELLGLNLQPVGGEVTTFLAKFADRNLVLVLALLAILFLDLPFDRQPVAVPSRNIIGILAKH